MQDVVTLKDTEGRFLLVNEAFCHIVGLSREEILGRHVKDVCTPELAEVLLHEDRQVLESGEGMHFTRDAVMGDVPSNLDVFKTLLRDADGEPYALLSVAHDNTSLLNALDEARKLAGEREVLLREVHHRVRNSLQVVASLMSMQARSADCPEAREILQRSIHRVESMMLIHEHLYQSGNFSSIDMQKYISALVLTVLQVYQMEGVTPQYHINVHVEGLHLSLERAVPCGLLVNELLTNAFRHAFVGRSEGVIDVSCTEEEHEGRPFVRLVVRDNGVGLSADMPPPEHLGSMLVNVLARQLHGVLEKVVDEGLQVRLTFPKEA